MKMFKDGTECNVQKDQVEAMENGGWCREAPEAEAPEAEETETPEVETPEVETPEVETPETPEAEEPETPEAEEEKAKPAVKLAKKRKPIARKTK